MSVHVYECLIRIPARHSDKAFGVEDFTIGKACIGFACAKGVLKSRELRFCLLGFACRRKRLDFRNFKVIRNHVIFRSCQPPKSNG